MTELATPAQTAAGATTSRRQVLAATGVVVAAAAVTAACGSSSSSSAAPAADGPLATTTDVPVGGGVINAGAKVVVTQPTAGEFKAFTAVCTHQGCVVSKIENGAIDCACHGSVFSATDGSVTTGPATSPLAPVAITVSGTTITRA
jgi:Rieske Fe-S protein